ncbi:hypothetical protein PGT21_018454 [Puccinia graminis f. sp. tritici]|uniref:Ferric oxidoreductase domain-containing protein n=1 Tax=Puccinia graminis f. sp. tritici TaxID=56615 RepID=A0A5B0PTR4_PUCGR|nr:hypothetical protein PGTUg99_034425 [Puccinia graminis f. sp. tritici]KAA1104296.1 hypothetical protein PGT21_018454 [Puccinia graminis f. sp. tritici]
MASQHNKSSVPFSSLAFNSLDQADELDCADHPFESPNKPSEVTQLCANEDPNNSSTELDSDTDYESDADSNPKTNNFGRRKTDFESQSSHSDNRSCEEKIFHKDSSFDNWKNAIEQKSPSVAPEISWWTTLLTWFTPYRQLFVLTFGFNFAGAVSVLSGYWPWAFRHLTPMVVGNVLFAIGIRSEWVLRFLYWFAIKTFRPRLFPLWLRVNVVGILYHIGGVHSGCGLSALLWLSVASSVYFQNASQHSIITLISLGICQACLYLTCLSAFPFVRGRHHNLFEIIHRFVGWIGIVSTITFVIVESLWDVVEHRWDSSASRLITKPELWFLTVIVIIILFSWITIAKVPVTVYTSSDKASVIRVPGGLTSGLHTRISVGGLREWHIFGSISEGKHAKYHYIVAAVQGEFTKMLNVEKPARLYTKRWKPCGLPYFSRLFKRGVAICTGSGIGAVASTCIQHDTWFLIWIGPNLESTYGKEIMQLIHEKIPENRRLIWDTRGPLGRPDVVRLLKETHQYWEAEVTLFVGSPEMNSNVLQSSRALNIPAFGSIWDA